MSGEMKDECGIDFHNVDDKIAHGHEITFKGSVEGAAGRIKREAIPVVAEQASAKWITQCTYWHLLKEFVKPISDPNVILVRGFIDRSGIPVQGQLFPAYQLFGVVESGSR